MILSLVAIFVLSMLVFGAVIPNEESTKTRLFSFFAICAIVVSLLYASNADASAGCNTRECHVRVLSKKCSNKAPRTCVEWIIARHEVRGWHAAWLRRIPGCESGWDPYARNPSGSSGLYQFLPSTWATTPYAHKSIWSARWQSAAARWMVVVAGRSREWVCH